LTVSLEFSEAWSSTYPQAAIGLLAMGNVRNSAPSPILQARLQSVEAEVRGRHAGQSRRDLETLPALRAYIEHYRRFSKSYHVLLQLESVAFRGRPLAAGESLVGAMFAAEIDTYLLTAGHDLDRLGPPLIADVTEAGEQYVGLGGRMIEVKSGDMSIRDQNGIISSVLYGPDERTRLTPETHSVLFTTYAPGGISHSDVERHLREIDALVRVDSPEATTLLLRIAR
jgi:DNA/RNA-binding domain of Phe-tRNA-synthetase-like protein